MAKDAELVGAALREAGFEVTLKRDLKTADLASTFKEFFALKGQDPEARLFVWYAGHGHTMNGEGFLVPADAPPASDPRFLISALQIRDFGGFTRLARSKHVYAVFDSCFAGTIFDSARSAPPPSITLATTKPVRQFLTSGDAGQQVSDDGRFRDLFLRALRGAERADANGDGYVTASEIGLYISDRVTNLTQRRQVPRYGKLRDENFDQGDFVFARLNTAEPPSLLPTPPVSPIALDPIDRGYVVKEQDGARVREQPDVRSRQVTTLKLGEAVHVLGKVKGEAWVLVERGGKTLGYMAVGLLQEAEEWRKQQVAVAPPPPPAAAPAARPVQPVVGVYPQGPAPGTVFRDCADCPEMVVVPAGSFMMGSPANEQGRSSTEGPQHLVTISRSFSVGKYEVTFDQWDACVAQGGCGGYRPSDENWGRGAQPVINVSWDDAKAYVDWLSRKTGKSYRLLSEAEWEYSARGGTTTRYWWGDEVGRNNASCDGCGSQWDNKQTAPVGSFKANAFGLHDMLGNVWEWVGDCGDGSYAGAPTDGSAWEARGECGLRVLRGGSWFDVPRILRAADRSWSTTGYRDDGAGFRVARTD